MKILNLSMSDLGFILIKKNDVFEDIVKLKNILVEYKEINQLPEEYVEKFCQKLVSIPQLIEQISKIIVAKKQG